VKNNYTIREKKHPKKKRLQAKDLKKENFLTTSTWQSFFSKSINNL
jgi:hypothetical protein